MDDIAPFANESQSHRGAAWRLIAPVVVAVAAIATLAVAFGSAGSASASASAPTGVYWGATLGSQFGEAPPWNMQSVTAFANADAGGKAPSLVTWGSPWYSPAYCSGYCQFQETAGGEEYQKVASYGAIPVISWESTGSDSDTEASGYTDAEIAAGSQDAYITAWAKAAKAWGHPFFLRFDWEMNGNWFPWGVGVNGNTAASYVAMWQHVHNIFTSVGATNVTWVWCPNIDPGGDLASIASLYPGDQYVDWTGLDGYNEDSPWASFATLYSSTYATITSLAPSKPMMVAEVGSTETGGSKAQWITDMFDALPTQFPDIHALMWYDETSYSGGYSDWPIESSNSSQAAFASGIASPTYETNQYSSLATSPIPAPGAVSTATAPPPTRKKKTPAEIRAQLVRQLKPSGPGARFSALLRSGGYRFSFTVPSGGHVAISWYLESRKSVLIATGRASRSTAGAVPLKLRLTRRGRQFLAKGKRLELTADGTFTPTGSSSVGGKVKFALTRR